LFGFEISLTTGAIVLMAEAEGYMPAESDPLNRERSKATIELKKGVGPHGTLVLPDGKAADGVTVCHLAANEQAALNDKGALLLHENRAQSTTMTDPEGEFSFAPKLGDCELFAACEKGFAHCGAADLLTANGKLTLQPWAKIHGRLIQKGKPAASEHVDLGWPNGYSFAAPFLNLHGSRTDDDGRFSIEHVPPGEMQITTRLMMKEGGGNGWTSTTQKKFTVKPGEDLDLGDIEKKPGTRPGG
jgi:hypothetical protein